MWIVKLGLERPYTFIVGALLVLVFGSAVPAQHADGHLPRDQDPGGDGHLVVQPGWRRRTWSGASSRSMSAR